MKIFCHVTLAEPTMQKLYDGITTAHSVTFRQQLSEEESIKAFLDSEIIFGNPPLGWFSKANRIQWVQLESVGLNPYDKRIAEGDIMFTNLKGFFNRPVSETVLGAIFLFNRGFLELMSSQRSKQWIKDELRSSLYTLADNSVIILGGGSIGQTISQQLRFLGAEVKMYDRNSELSDFGNVDELLKHMGQCDVLIGCLPENEDTVQFLDSEKLSTLGKNAILINVGRGSLIDEKALIALLKDKKIKGAFLDVTDKEPVPENSVVWEVPNLVLGQHAGGGSHDEIEKKVAYFIKNLRRFEQDRLVPIQLK